MNNPSMRARITHHQTNCRPQLSAHEACEQLDSLTLGRPLPCHGHSQPGPQAQNGYLRGAGRGAKQLAKRPRPSPGRFAGVGPKYEGPNDYLRGAARGAKVLAGGPGRAPGALLASGSLPCAAPGGARPVGVPLGVLLGAPGCAGSAADGPLLLRSLPHAGLLHWYEAD